MTLENYYISVDNFKINLEEMGIENGNESASKQIPVADSCEHGDESLGSVNSRECHYQLSNNYRAKVDTDQSNVYN